MEYINYIEEFRLFVFHVKFSKRLFFLNVFICKLLIGGYQCELWGNRTTVDHIFSIWLILGKKWEYNNEICHLLIAFEKA